MRMAFSSDFYESHLRKWGRYLLLLTGLHSNGRVKLSPTSPKALEQAFSPLFGGTASGFWKRKWHRGECVEGVGETHEKEWNCTIMNVREFGLECWRISHASVTFFALRWQHFRLWSEVTSCVPQVTLIGMMPEKRDNELKLTKTR